MIGICCDVMSCVLVNTDFAEDIRTLIGRQDQAVFNRSSQQKLRLSFSPTRLTVPEILVRVVLRGVSNIRVKRFWRFEMLIKNMSQVRVTEKQYPLLIGCQKHFMPKKFCMKYGLIPMKGYNMCLVCSLYSIRTKMKVKTCITSSITTVLYGRVSFFCVHRLRWRSVQTSFECCSSVHTFFRRAN
jgi:hypothetical protein